MLRQGGVKMLYTIKVGTNMVYENIRCVTIGISILIWYSIIIKVYTNGTVTCLNRS